MNKFFTLFCLLSSLFFVQKSYSLIQFPYKNHNILLSAFADDTDQCFTIEPVLNENNIFIQNITTQETVHCFNKKIALMTILSQSLLLDNYKYNYQILVDNLPLPEVNLNISPEEEVFQIQTLFSNNSNFVSAEMAEWVRNPSLPHMSPAIMIFYQSKVMSFYSDDISENKNKTYLTTAQFFKQLFDFRKLGMGISHTIY